MRQSFPSVKAVAQELRGLKAAGLFYEGDAEEEGGPYVDVRLQVSEGGGWDVLFGDSCYDTDHRGYWGATELTPHTNCLEAARELIGGARDDYAMSR